MTGKEHSGDILVERIEGMSVSFTVGELEEEQMCTTPPYEHRTVVKPLFGLLRVGKERYELEDPFDWVEPPIKYKRWMNLKVMEVGGCELNAERILRLLANYEGAHVNSNELTRDNASLPVDVQLPNIKDELYRKSNWVTFGGASYPHIFAIHVGVYLINMMKATLKHASMEARQSLRIMHLENSLRESPSLIAPLTLSLEKPFSMGMLLQSTSDSFEVVGNPENPGTTTIQIPGW